MSRRPLGNRKIYEQLSRGQVLDLRVLPPGSQLMDDGKTENKQPCDEADATLKKSENSGVFSLDVLKLDRGCFVFFVFFLSI